MGKDVQSILGREDSDVHRAHHTSKLVDQKVILLNFTGEMRNVGKLDAEPSSQVVDVGLIRGVVQEKGHEAPPFRGATRGRSVNKAPHPYDTITQSDAASYVIILTQCRDSRLEMIGA